MTFVVYAGAALAEIAGCYAFWAWLRVGHSPWWVLPGLLSLGVFATLLTISDSSEAGRAYAAYGGVYIAVCMFWLFAAEGRIPDRWDVAGVTVCLGGAAIILWAPHSE